MDQSYVMLLFILSIGLLMKNNPLSIAGAVLILLKLLKLDNTFSKLEAHGLKTGIIILTIGILTPIAADKYTIKDIWMTIKSPLGVTALLSGMFVMYLTKNGYHLLTTEASIVLPLILGSIIGIILFKGVPVGPLISAGLTVILYNIFQSVGNLLK